MEHGILKVSEKEVGDLEAHAVKIGVTVEGQNFLYGNAALEKCAEVKAAVEKLVSVESQIAIHVKSVVIKSETGWFSKSSKGVYRIELLLDKLDKINDVLGVIMDLPNATMNSLEWVFDEDPMKIDLIKKAMTKAKRKAEAMTSSVGYKIVGIRACADSYEVPNVNVAVRSALGDSGEPVRFMSKASKSMITADIGTEIRGKKEISAVASVEFVIDKDTA